MSKDEEDLGMSPLRQGAIQIHEMYEEFKRAGFSRREAMELTTRMMSQALGQAFNQDENE